MTEKLFCVGVARFTAFDQDDQVVLRGKSLLDSTFKTSLSKAEIRGGKGNALLMNYFHTSAMDVNISNPVWDIQYIASAVGSTLVTGTNVYVEETITLGASGSGTVVGTPVETLDTHKYGWITQVNGSVERVEFTGQAWSSSTGTSGDVICIKYFALDSAAKSITISSRIIPSVLKFLLEVDLASNEDSSNIVGKIEVVIPKVQLDGVVEIGMKADGNAVTPLHGTALASTPPSTLGCADTDVYAYVTQVRTGALWYDGLVALGIVSGDFSITHPGTKTMVVKGVFNDGSVSTIANSLLTFASSVTGKATVGANTGVVTTVATGDTVIHVTPVAAGAVAFDASVTCSVV